MSAKRVTVFGGSGFIGRYVVKRLAAAGWRVAVPVRRIEQAKFLKPMGAVGQIVPVATSVSDPDSVAAAVNGADVVINLVGILHESGQQGFDAIHQQGAMHVARAAEAAGVERLIQISAIGADNESKSAYARSKAAGELAAKEAFPEVTILRPSVVFGPEDNFLNMFAWMASISPCLPLIGGGETRFQPIYVGDVADAVMSAIQRDDAKGKTYELGGPTVYSFRELIEFLLKEIRRKRLLVPIPFGIARIKAAVLELLPKPLLTRDQVTMLESDNVVAPGAATLAHLGVTPTALEIVAPSYLERYRPGGRFNPQQA